MYEFLEVIWNIWANIFLAPNPSPDGNDSLVRQKACFCGRGGATKEATTTTNKNRFLQTSYSGQLDQAPKKNVPSYNLHYTMIHF